MLSSSNWKSEAIRYYQLFGRKWLPCLKLEILASFSTPRKKNRGKIKLLENRLGYFCTNPDVGGKKRIYLMSQHEWVETSRKPLPCPCCASLNKRPKQIPVHVLYLVKNLSAPYPKLASYIGYLAGVCRLRCASVWQSVQQHSRTGPQPGSIFHA